MEIEIPKFRQDLLTKSVFIAAKRDLEIKFAKVELKNMLNNENSPIKDVFLGILTEVGFVLALFLLMAFMAMIGEILSR